MLKASSSSAIKFALRPTAETLADLSRPNDPRHLKTRKQGNTTLTYCPWNTIARHLHHRAPGWCWEDECLSSVVIYLRKQCGEDPYTPAGRSGSPLPSGG